MLYLDRIVTYIDRSKIDRYIERERENYILKIRLFVMFSVYKDKIFHTRYVASHGTGSRVLTCDARG